MALAELCSPKTELVEYKDSTGNVFEAFVARDSSKAGKCPVVLIFPTYAGRTEAEEAKAQQLAELGYVGFAADVYGKGVRGSTPEENMALCKPLMSDRTGSLRDRLFAVLEAARKLPYVDPRKVSAIGYCFGGTCALDLARFISDPQLSLLGVVSLHGGLTKFEGDKAMDKIHSKILVCHGYADPHIPPQHVLDFGKEMTERGADWQLHAYGHVFHGFTNKKANDEKRGVKYDANADRRSSEATRYFLHECFSS